MCASKEIGIVMTAKSGRTTLANSLDSKKQLSTIFIDLDTAVLDRLSAEDKVKIEAWNNEGDTNAVKNKLLPIYSQFRKECKKSYRGKKIFYFSSSASLLEHIGLSTIVPIIPSKLLMEQILAKVSDEEKTLIQNQKAEILQTATKDPIVYDTFQELARVFTKRFQLKLKL
jgi:hypothetical protein